MKKQWIIFGLLIALLLMLAGCSDDATDAATEAAAPAHDTVTDEQPVGEETAADAMPAATELLLGTMLLEETEEAVTPEQAEELLVLWKAYNALTNSDTTAPEELDAVTEQIEGKMTDEQMAAIEAMEITPQAMVQLMADLGIEITGFGGRAGTEGEFPEGSEMPEGFQRPEGATRPEGMQPGQGGGPGGGQFDSSELSPEAQATLEAMQESRGGFARSMALTPALYDALIDLLETRAAE